MGYVAGITLCGQQTICKQPRVSVVFTVLYWDKNVCVHREMRTYTLGQSKSQLIGSQNEYYVSKENYNFRQVIQT
jgi:hypothetical protein